MLDMSDDADNLRLGINDAHVDSLADWIFVREIFSGEVFVDDDHRRRMLVILLVEKSAAMQGNLHRAQVSRLHHIKKRKLHFAFTGGFGLTFEPKRVFAV